MQKCHLCLQEKELKNSHIYPRAYLKAIKQNSPQLVVNTIDDNTKPQKLNFNPTEYLLCHECEQFIANEYENYGIKILNAKNKCINYPDSVAIINIDYQRFYLYLLSMLWRASISTLTDFDKVNLSNFNGLLREQIFNQKIEINDGVRIDHFFKIIILRMVSSGPEIPQSVIDNSIFGFSSEFAEEHEPKKMIVYFFMISGYLVVYYLYPARNRKESDNLILKGQLLDVQKNRFPKVSVDKIKPIYQAYNNISEKKERFGISFS